MEFKDYYAALGVAATATQDEIKRAYRKQARKYHPDVSKEPDAEARFKDVAEAYEALTDAEKRAAYDDVVARHKHGQQFNPPPGWDSGFEFSGRDAGGGDNIDHSEFFESLFGQQFGRQAGADGGGRQGRSRPSRRQDNGPARGQDHHAKMQITLQDAYQGGQRGLQMRAPHRDEHGQVTMQDRQLDVNIPKGVRPGQQLRLVGQGGTGLGGGPAGDLYLEIELAPHPSFRVDGRDVYLDLPVAPWEAALGAQVTVHTPAGAVDMTVPAGSTPGRKLRLKGRGLPSSPPGDLYVVLGVALPGADTEPAQAAYRAMASAFAGFNPRQALEA